VTRFRHGCALAALDARDLEILELLVDGLTTSQMATGQYLAPRTISEMLDKMGVASRDEAIALGRATGLGGHHPPARNV
jgi:DNA-binding CsgD family transcriptional regulator